MAGDIHDPLVTQEVDCTDLDGFMLNVERLMASELVALSSHEVIGAALLLWCRAWKQRPAASLPNDDKVIAAFARMPLARFRKLRDEVLRGFVMCSDGRLYHSTLAREAINAYERKLTFQRKREADAERLRKWRSGNKHETPQETQDETRFVAEGQGQGQGHLKPPYPPRGQGPASSPPEAEAAPPRGEGRFPEFWAAWPSSERKQDRKKCLAKWLRNRLDTEADTIIAHVMAAKASRKWREGFEPAPMTYLNGERWRDGTEVEAEPTGREGFL